MFTSLVAIRFFRHLVNHAPDEFYIKLVAEKQVLGPILDVLLVTLPRDNLLSSACLDIFEYIRKEGIRDLIKHTVENYREKLAALSYIETFRELIRVNEHIRGYASMENLFMESEEEMERRPPHVNGQMMEHLGMDPIEDEYWNGSDEEDEAQNKLAARNPLGNGSGPLSALVDYHSDEESDENGDVAMKGAKSMSDGPSGKSDKPSSSNTDIKTSDVEAVPTLFSSTPPERLSEKRRREEDDDDELGKMMQHKRRNSQSGLQNSVGSAAALRKKKSFSLSAGSESGSRKIDIRLSNAVQSAVSQGSSGQEGDA